MFLPPHCSWFFFLWSCQIPSDSTQGVWIQSKEEQTCSFNASQFKSARKTRNILVHKLIFAANISFAAHNRQNAHEIITCFSKSTKAFGLKINLKTEVMYPPHPRFYYTDREPGSNLMKQIQISRLHSCVQQ